MKYVRAYANSEADVREFKRQWCLKVKEQLDNKHEKIRNDSRDEYDKTITYDMCYSLLGNDTICIEISNWHMMNQELHEQRMNEIVRMTVFGEFVVNYSLRPNPRIVDSYIEYNELKLPKNNSMSSYQFKELYKLCCNSLGYNHMM